MFSFLVRQSSCKLSFNVMFRSNVVSFVSKQCCLSHLVIIRDHNNVIHNNIHYCYIHCTTQHLWDETSSFSYHIVEWIYLFIDINVNTKCPEFYLLCWSCDLRKDTVILQINNIHNVLRAHKIWPQFHCNTNKRS